MTLFERVAKKIIKNPTTVGTKMIMGETGNARGILTHDGTVYLWTDTSDDESEHIHVWSKFHGDIVPEGADVGMILETSVSSTPDFGLFSLATNTAKTKNIEHIKKAFPDLRWCVFRTVIADLKSDWMKKYNSYGRAQEIILANKT